MAKSDRMESKPKGWARAFEFGRNFNALATAIGALAVAGATALGLPAAVKAVLWAWTGINAAQTAGFELLRRHTLNKQKAQAVGEVSAKNAISLDHYRKARVAAAKITKSQVQSKAA